MGYVICEKCGGYYKLEKGESFEDFDRCQCGGSLKYVKSIQKRKKKQKNYIKCTICGHEQEKSLLCSKCGSKIRLKVSPQNRNYRNRHDYKHLAEDDLFNRIEWN